MDFNFRQNQAREMVRVLSQHCSNLQIAALRQVGRQDEQIITNKYNEGMLRWAGYENAKNNANIFVRPNPKQNHPWLILDDLTFSSADAICENYQAVAVETSESNFQVRLLTDCPLNVNERFLVQKELAIKYGGDLGATSGDRWGRLAGFDNKKEGKDNFFTILVATPDTRSPRFDTSPYLLKSITPPAGGGGVLHAVKPKAPLKIAGKNGNSQSENDFGFVINRLRFYLEKGYDWQKEASVIKQKLTEQSSRKKNDRDYAERTVNAALRELGL